MYQKYQTPAIILRSYERGEADRVFALYTEEFGHVWARASSVRRESSRQRYALQNYAIANVSLVRGKAGWRLAGASALASVGDAGSTFARISNLVGRLVGGEGRNEYLFQTLLSAHEALRAAPDGARGAIELLAVARILYALGYVSAEALGTALFTHTAFSPEELTEAESARSELLVSVNRALSETHL